ncbi:MAG: amidohydrolase family protein, partial [Candidatus Hodarchaeota archaeon]
MILKNGNIYSAGKLREGTILIQGNKIESISFEPTKEKNSNLKKQNTDRIEIDCQNKLILPGLIDIHSHLRDMGQKEKETFRTATKAAAISGITTVFNMPNTIPPAIDSKQVKKWMNKALNNIFIDVGFIAGVPNDFNSEEIKKIIELGVIGFKIYPNNPINNIDWKEKDNLKNIFKISSKYNKPIFIHPEWPLLDTERQKIIADYTNQKFDDLELHDRLKSVKTEIKYIEFVINEYKNYINEKKLN